MLKDIKDAWNELHSIQCALEYYMMDTNSKMIQLPKHALDMMIKHLIIKIKEAKALCWKDIDERERVTDDGK